MINTTHSKWEAKKSLDTLTHIEPKRNHLVLTNATCSNLCIDSTLKVTGMNLSIQLRNWVVPTLIRSRHAYVSILIKMNQDCNTRNSSLFSLELYFCLSFIRVFFLFWIFLFVPRMKRSLEIGNICIIFIRICSFFQFQRYLHAETP